MIWLLGIASFLIAFLVTPLVGSWASGVGLVDSPVKKRKVHRLAVPLAGGMAIFVALVVITGVVLLRSDLLTSGEVSVLHYIGIALAVLILLVGGYLDDRRDLDARYQVVFPILAALVAILFGLGVEKVTNPFGGVVFLDHFVVNFFETPLGNIGFSWPGDVLVFLWLMGTMYTVKILDGLDGLATGIGSVGVLMVLFLSASAAFYQPDVVVFSSIVFGGFLGFLYWNWYPAKVFLGEGGGLMVGFLLGALAVISGGKIATLLLVMGVPIMDVVWAIARRVRSGEKVTDGDRRHLHHRLFDLGLSHGQIVVIYLVVAFVFGVLTLFLSSFAKLLALILLCIVMVGGVYLILSVENKKKNRKK